MKSRKFFKKVYMKINPTYRKLAKVQEDMNGVLNAISNQCWAMRYQVNLLEEEIKQLNALKNAEVSRNLKITEELKTIQNMLWFAVQNNKATFDEARENFWKNYPKTSTPEMELVQQVNLVLVKKLKKVCDKNGLKFWMHGGTLIGAIRHSGFIPWDDDVDVAMLREDLEKLKEVLKDDDELQLCEYYHEDVQISKGYQIKFKNPAVKNFIDIVCYDKVCIDKNDNKGQTKLAEIRKVRASLVDDFMKNHRNIKTQDIGYYKFGPLDDSNKKIVDGLFEKYNKQIKNSGEDVSYFYGIDNYPFPYPVMRENEIFPLKEISFEGFNVYIPNDSKFYLDGYGDFYQLPKDFGKHQHIYAFEGTFEDMKKIVKDKNKK